MRAVNQNLKSGRLSAVNGSVGRLLKTCKVLLFDGTNKDNSTSLEVDALHMQQAERQTVLAQCPTYMAMTWAFIGLCLVNLPMSILTGNKTRVNAEPLFLGPFLLFLFHLPK